MAGCPVAASHTRTLWSLPLETITSRPATLPKSHRKYNAAMTGTTRVGALPGGRVPHPHRLVGATGDDQVAAGRPTCRHRVHPIAVVSYRVADRLTGGRIAHPDRPVMAAGNDHVAAIRLTGRYRVHPASMSGQRVTAGCRWPHPILGPSRHGRRRRSRRDRQTDLPPPQTPRRCGRSK